MEMDDGWHRFENPAWWSSERERRIGEQKRYHRSYPIIIEVHKISTPGANTPFIITTLPQAPKDTEETYPNETANHQDDYITSVARILHHEWYLQEQNYDRSR